MTYRAPVSDIAIALKSAGLDSALQDGLYGELDQDTVDAVLEEAGRFASDVLAPLNSNRIGETIMALHAVVVRSNYEWLNEVMVIRHSIYNEPKVYNTPGFYTQISRQFGSFRPYFRYQYINAAKTEPVFPDVGLNEGPSAGIRFDASEFVALKLQYDYTVQRQQPNYSTVTLQIGFTF